MTKASCSIDGCERSALARTLCTVHYQRWLHNGTTDDPRPTVEQRFWSKVNKTATCWLWTASRSDGGYAQFAVSRRQKKTTAHRVAYELLVGPIPDGLELDHLCRVRHCVNPAHLEPVTRQENARRALAVAAPRVLKTHCSHGHEFTPENTRISHGQRWCRACQRRNMAEYRLRLSRKDE